MPLPLLAIAASILGAIVGSFLATILMRWPAGGGVVSGRSRCDHCGAALSAAELVPILSWIVTRGRCRRCGARIDWRHPAIELTAAVIGLVSALAHPLPLAVATMVFGWLLLILAALDAEHEWLPDALTLPLIGAGLLFGGAGLGPPLPDRALGAAAGWLVLTVIALAYRRMRGREGLGGGDPKLLAGIGAWLGLLYLPFVLLGAGLIGLVALLAMKARGQEVGRATRLPLGTLMALAAWPIWLIFDTIYSGSVHINLL